MIDDSASSHRQTRGREAAGRGAVPRAPAGRGRYQRRRRRTLIAALLLLLAAGPALAQPTVNGLFYGDGDSAEYVLWNTSLYGSGLYIYYDAASTTLYAALVVNRSVNDNVFTDNPPDTNSYMQSAGWGGGSGQQRDASKLTDSEFATFTLECAPGTGPKYEWLQGYACNNVAGPPPSSWVSDLTCPGSMVISGDPTTLDLALDSSSSFVANANTYQTAPAPPVAWNMYIFGQALGNWKSPTEFATTVINAAEGYPAPTDPGDLSLGPPITYSSNYEYEWAMVYEWSMNLATAGCGSEAIFLVTGLSHHSPMKTGAEGLHDDVCGEENDCFPDPPGGGNPLSDYGDLPDTLNGQPTSYGTLDADNGPRHQIDAAGPFLGSNLDPEPDGTPDTGAAADDGAGIDDEDGVTAVVNGDWTVGSQQTFNVVSSGTGVLGAWIDWNGDGDFDDANEYVTIPVVAGNNTLTVTVGDGFDWNNDPLHARFRLFSSGATAPGGSLDSGDFVGQALDGEVEDYVFGPGSLPVTLNAFTSEFAGRSVVTVRWQTASETDNVGFELLGRVHGKWRPLSEFVPSTGMDSALPQDYTTEIFLPPGLDALELVDYDSRGRPERFGPFRPGASYGEFQPSRRIDWSGPRGRRQQRLAERGFVDTGRLGGIAAGKARPARWKKLERPTDRRGSRALVGGSRAVSFESGRGEAIRWQAGPLTHVAVTEPGIQRVSYEALRDAGLDLAGVRNGAIAVSWRGQPVARWVEGRGTFGPGSWIEFLGRPPAGDDALYLDGSLYQVSVDPARVLAAGRLGRGTARRVSPAYLQESMLDRPAMYHRQSPTGDPWVEQSVLVRGAPRTVTLEIPVEGPVRSGPSRAFVGLGTVSDLPDLIGPGGEVLPEHNVEVWFSGPGEDWLYLTRASTSARQDWWIEADIPRGALRPGINRLQLRFSSDYFFSLVLIDRYGLRYPGPYRGPELDFPVDPRADGYRIDGFAGPAVLAYAELADGGLTRIDPRIGFSGGGFTAELRQLDGVHFWVTERPHLPAVFTTGAAADLLSVPAELVVIAESSFVGTPALADYLAQRADLDPVVVDVEDIYNGVGFGMALPGAITDYLELREQVQPFSHVQLVGTDCYDRLNYLSDCVSFIPLPTAPVGVNVYSPSQNRLVDLDGDGVGDKAVGQFSVREEAELETIVRKAADWDASGLSGQRSALLIAEETDGVHSFSNQVERLDRRLRWPATELLDMTDHPDVGTARQALRAALDEGRTLTVFSGHSSPSVWAYRALLTADGVGSLTNFGLPTVMVPLACETTYDISPDADVLGHQLLYAGEQGALAISGAVALSSLDDNERMAGFVLDGLRAGLTLGEAVQSGRRALGAAYQTLQDNWVTQGDVAARIAP